LKSFCLLGLGFSCPWLPSLSPLNTVFGRKVSGTCHPEGVVVFFFIVRRVPSQISGPLLHSYLFFLKGRSLFLRGNKTLSPKFSFRVAFLEVFPLLGVYFPQWAELGASQTMGYNGDLLDHPCCCFLLWVLPLSSWPPYTGDIRRSISPRLGSPPRGLGRPLKDDC